MVKCTKKQIRELKTALRWKIPAAQRERIQMVLLRESGMTQPAIARGSQCSTKPPSLRDHPWHRCGVSPEGYPMRSRFHGLSVGEPTSGSASAVSTSCYDFGD